MRILFGDKEAYLEKFSTFACVREFGYQNLGVEFYKSEHSKPLFNNYSIMNVRNLDIFH